MPDEQGSTVVSSQGGGSFSYDGAQFRITSLDVSGTATQADVSHLGIISGLTRIFKKAPLADSPEVKIDFIGTSLPAVGTKKNFVLTGNFASLKTSLCTKAICTQASLKATVGDIVKGSATFKLSKN
jgi:hypothetical protein